MTSKAGLKKGVNDRLTAVPLQRNSGTLFPKLYSVSQRDIEQRLGPKHHPGWIRVFSGQS